MSNENEDTKNRETDPDSEKVNPDQESGEEKKEESQSDEGWDNFENFMTRTFGKKKGDGSNRA